MAYSTQQDLELRIGTAHLRELTNDAWETDPPDNLIATGGAGGHLTGTHYYVVTALNDKGETIQSDEVSFTADITNKTASLGWDDVATATSYKVYRSTTSGAYISPCLLAHITDTDYDDDGSITSLLTGAPPSDASLPDATVVAALIEKADREIDGRAGQIYDTPFVPATNCDFIPNPIKQISIDLALYYCFMRRFSETEVPKQWQTLYSDAKKRLEDVANLSIPLDGNPVLLSPEAQIIAPDDPIPFNDPTSPWNAF